MQKLWAVFFGVVLGGIFALCVVAPWVGWWMPHNISSYGGDVDNLFNVILVFTGAAFVLTEALLVWCMWRYAHRPGRKAAFVHGNHRLELVWTVATAAILLYIAFAQVNVWERIKYQGLMPQPDLLVQVTGRQWEWRLRYPADVTRTDAAGRAWAEAPEVDDVRIQNELHTWPGAKVRIYLKTQDVIHSFGLPNLRLMQDALPGKTIPMWFEINKDDKTAPNTQWNEATGRCDEAEDASRRYEIACKELCGGGHYRMRGRIYVHPSQEDFMQWLNHQRKAQDSHEPETNPRTPGTPVASNGS